MGGYVGERIGTKDAAEGAQRRAQSYYHEKIAKPAAEAGLHAGQQTGMLMDKFNQEMTNTADAFSRSDLNITNWGKRDDKDQGAQTAVGKYSTSAQAKGKSGKSGAKGSQLETRESRKIKGKGKLYVK